MEEEVLEPVDEPTVDSPLEESEVVGEPEE